MTSITERLKSAGRHLLSKTLLHKKHGETEHQGRLRSRRPFFEQFEQRRVLTTTVLSAFDTTLTAIVRTGSIQSTNTQDIYRLTLVNPSIVRTDLIGMAANLDLTISNQAGTELASSLRSGNAFENFTTTLLPIGQYNVRVDSVASAASTYTIILGTVGGDDMFRALETSAL